MSQRQPRLYDRGFLAFLHTKACCVCGSRLYVQAAHIRMGLTGMMRRPHDKYAVPLCMSCHLTGPNAQHKMSEAKFWEMHRKDPFEIAFNLYLEYGGDGGKPKGPSKVKARKPKASRAPFRNGKRPWPKLCEGSRWPSRKLTSGASLSSSRRSSRRKPSRQNPEHGT